MNGLQLRLELRASAGLARREGRAWRVAWGLPLIPSPIFCPPSRPPSACAARWDQILTQVRQDLPQGGIKLPVDTYLFN